MSDLTLNSKTDEPSERCACRYCGLPVPRHRRPTDGESDAFCCFGCRLVYGLAKAGESDPQALGQSGLEEPRSHPLLLRLGLGIFLTMNMMVFNWFFYSQHVYDHDTTASQQTLSGLFAYLLMLLCTLVVVTLGFPLAIDAARSSISRSDEQRRWRWGVTLDVNALIIVGVMAAYTLSVVNTIRGEGPLYYDTAAMILVLVTLGAFLDSRAKRSATSEAMSLLATVPSKAWVRETSVRKADERLDGDQDDQPASICEIESAAVLPGDEVRVRPGEVSPVDGQIIEGASHLNEASLTGESKPRAVRAGDTVLAGTIVLDGQIWVRASGVGEDRVVAQVNELFRRVQSERPAVQRLADKIASVFVPGVLLLAIGVFMTWALFGHPSEGLFAALSVLLISCPCALGLAAPLASYHAMASAARRGILFRSATALEQAAKIKRIMFDKTGTLTESQMKLARVDVLNPSDIADEDLCLAIAAAIESGSTHPLANVVVQAARLNKVREVTATGVVTHPGLGVEAIVDGVPWRLGSQRFVEESRASGHDLNSEIERNGFAVQDDERPQVFLFRSDAVVARFVFDEKVRADAASAIASLREQGVHASIVSGDRTAPVSAVAGVLGIPYESQLLPQNKVDQLEHAKAEQPGVAFVGDGLNDAPVLAAADLGIAMGQAVDIAKHAGDVQLLNNRLEQVPVVLAIARDTFWRIKLNLAWAFGYNGIGITIAAMGWLNPIFAASAMIVSSLLIVTISSRAGDIGLNRLGADQIGEANAVDVIPSELGDQTKDSVARTDAVVPEVSHA